MLGEQSVDIHSQLPRAYRPIESAHVILLSQVEFGRGKKFSAEGTASLLLLWGTGVPGYVPGRGIVTVWKIFIGLVSLYQDVRLVIQFMGTVLGISVYGLVQKPLMLTVPILGITVSVGEVTFRAVT